MPHNGHHADLLHTCTGEMREVLLMLGTEAAADTRLALLLAIPAAAAAARSCIARSPQVPTCTTRARRKLQ